MNTAIDVLAYTPIVQFFLLYGWQYRYSLKSIFTNTREKDDWERVLKELTGVDYGVKRSEHFNIALVLGGIGASAAIYFAGLSAIFSILAQFIPAVYFLVLVRYYAGPPPTSFMSYHIKSKRGPLLKYLKMTEN